MDTQEKKVDARRLIITITLVLITALLIGGGVWYFMDQNQKDIQATNEKTTQDLQKQIDALNAKSSSTSTNNSSNNNSTTKTYTNSDLGISFDYPNTYTLTTTGSLKPGQISAGNIVLTDNTKSGVPRLSISVNPDGMGGCMQDKNDYQYTLAVTNGQVSVSKRELQSDSPCEYNPSVVTMFRIGSGDYQATPFKNSLFGVFSDSTGKNQNDLEQILASFKISNTSLYGL